MKNILIGVSGGIAAYKAANIVSGLRKRGYDVKVVMTENAAKIITPLAFESLSKHDVAVDMWERNFNVNVEHIALADWADIILVAPATYNIVGKVAGGIADDMLSTVGSTNVDFRSFEHNFEVNAFMYDVETALEMKEIFLQDQRESTQIFLKNWGRRSWRQKAAESIVRLLAPLL